MVLQVAGDPSVAPESFKAPFNFEGNMAKFASDADVLSFAHEAYLLLRYVLLSHMSYIRHWWMVQMSTR